MLPHFFLSKVQWVPKLLEPPAHTHINYVVTDLHGGPKPPALIEDSYRKKTLTVSRCVLRCWMQSDIWAFSTNGTDGTHSIKPFLVGVSSVQSCWLTGPIWCVCWVVSVSPTWCRLSQGGTFPGQLTTVGMEQLYELGKRLRSRYIENSHFLSSTFSQAEV